MAHREHIVKQGDCISSIAYDYGFFPDTLWNDPKNLELKRRRKDPNVLFPGDAVRVRELEEKDVPCATEQRHRFRRRGVPAKLIIQFKLDGEPRANEPYVLEIDGRLTEGKTDEDGIVRTLIPPNANKGTILFPGRGDEHELELGDLDPITETSGVQGRLRNLGYYAGPVDGKMSEQLEQAIRSFQQSRGVEPTGRLDEATRKMLHEASEE